MSQLALHFAHNPAFLPEDYLVSACNHDAHAWIVRWPDWPQGMLSVHGPEASGKTHLAHVWAARSQARFLNASQIGSAPSDRLLENARACVLERAGQAKDEEALFHLLNFVKAQGVSLLLCSIEPLTRVPFSLPDLRSRLAVIPSVALNAPDDEALFALIFKQFVERQIRVSADVIRYIISHTERSFRSARAWVERIDGEALRRKKPVTLALVRELIQDSTQE